ncbi:MAG: FadR/GntR family transcriptional regulator, partial [Actinomycetales bacterium]
MARLHREVLAVLVAEIVDGTFAPGTWLPREVDLAARFSISRGTSRECIRALEERGLVSVRHGKGAMVRPDTDWDVLDREVVTALLSSPHRSRVLGEVLQCRRALELTAVELAAERVTSAQLDQMRTAYRQMEQAVARQV